MGVRNRSCRDQRHFDFVPVGDNTPYYNLKPTHIAGRSMCLDVEASGTADGTRILQYPCTGNANQQFRLDTFQWGVRLRTSTGRCLSVPGDTQNWNAGIVLRSCSDTALRDSRWQVFERYCRQCVVNYADAHAETGRYNTDFPVFGNDCTNFVSQATAAGGLYMDTNPTHPPLWWWAGDHGDPSWTVAERHYYHSTNALIGQQLATYQALPHPNLTPLIRGDLIYYDWPDVSGGVNHDSVLVGWTDHDEVDEHTSDRYHAWWDLRGYDPNFGATRITAVHILDFAPVLRYNNDT